MARDKLEYQRNWRKENPGAYKEWKYGITQVEYDNMLRSQDYSCKLCHTKEPGGRHNTFHIDHCHKTDLVRGLLCWACNAGLGQFRDNIQTLKNAVEYLESYDYKNHDNSVYYFIGDVQDG